MVDLDFRFDELTESVKDRLLARTRAYGREVAAHFPPSVSVEIGSNRGDFLVALAARNPDRHYLGIEWRHKYARLSQEMAQKRGVTNIDFLAADANLALPVLMDEGQMQELFILFPDPWWKSRHRKRRVIQEEFLDMAARKMPAGGHLWIRTDVGPLADDMHEVVAAHGAFHFLSEEDMPLESFPRTTREVKIIAEGLPIHLLYLRRI